MKLDKADAEHKATCESYGIQFKQGESDRWYATHVHAGVLGPFDSELEVVEVAYNKWVQS